MKAGLWAAARRLRRHQRLHASLPWLSGLPYHLTSLAHDLVGYGGRPSEPRPLDLLFVVPDGGQGWVLDAICREIAAYFPGSWRLQFGLDDLPAASVYWVAHYSMLPQLFLRYPQARRSDVFVYFTHRRELTFSDVELRRVLGMATMVFCMNSADRQRLIDEGLEPAKVEVALPGADPDLFRPHERGGGAVGFCSAYYARKEPDRIHHLVRAMPDQQFLLLGRGWEAYPHFDELTALPNFRNVAAVYADYPGYYAQMDVFVSPSRLEGGPIPLIEAMMANALPVASRTGFAPDLIEHGRNGLLFDVDASTDQIAGLIRRARSMTADVRATVSHLTWQRMAEQVFAHLRRTDPGVDLG